MSILELLLQKLNVGSMNKNEKDKNELDYLDQVVFEQSDACSSISLAICAFSWAMFYTLSIPPTKSVIIENTNLLKISAGLSVVYVLIKLIRHVITIFIYRRRFDQIQKRKNEKVDIGKWSNRFFFLFSLEMLITLINVITLSIYIAKVF